jgi:hypothetical protein
MGTRHTYRIIERHTEEGKTKDSKLVLIYAQYDGYPNGRPLDVANFLSKGKLVNGYGPVGEGETVFNGCGCMTAQLIAHLKTGTGGVYIEPMASRGKSWEEYLYDIIVEGPSITIVGYENNKRPKEFFRGTPAEYITRYKED